MVDDGSASVLSRVMSGDADAVTSLADVTDEGLLRPAGVLMLHPGAVASVLRGLLTGRIDGSSAQRWASFVRRGYVPGGSGPPVTPLDIQYAPDHEDAIVETLARLDAIGDAVDGEVPSPQDIDILLSVLEA